MSAVDWAYTDATRAWMYELQYDRGVSASKIMKVALAVYLEVHEVTS